MNQSTSRTPPKRGPSTGAIWKNSLFLRLYELVDECTSPLVKHLPCVYDPCMQSRTTAHFQGSTSWSTSAPVRQSNTSHAWAIHVCNPEQLLVFRKGFLIKYTLILTKYIKYFNFRRWWGGGDYFLEVRIQYAYIKKKNQIELSQATKNLKKQRFFFFFNIKIIEKGKRKVLPLLLVVTS